MPLYTVTCSNGQVKQTQDLGRAMITGKCSDIGKFKGPILRGLAARAPYFHDGSAATLLGVCLIALGWQVRRRGRAKRIES